MGGRVVGWSCRPLGAVTAAVSVAVLAGLVAAPAALADDGAGAGFNYNSGTRLVNLHVKTNSTGPSGTSVDFTLPAGTTTNGTPFESSGGTCMTMGSQAGSCTFGQQLAPGQVTSVGVNTNGPKPVSVAVTEHFADGGSAAVTATECGSIGATPPSLPDGTVGTPYSQQFTGTGGPGPFTFVFSGSLPNGLALAQSGLLAGTPTAGGTSSFQLIPYDNNGCSPSPPDPIPSYTIKINDAPGGGGNTPCSIQPTPPVTPSFQRPCADIQVTRVAPGLFLFNDVSEVSAINEEIRRGLPLPITVAATQESSRFKGFSYWQVGETVQFLVTIFNNGDDPGTFTLDVPSGFTYVGQLVMGPTDDDIIDHGPLPSLLPAHHVIDLVFQAPLKKEGPLTFTAGATSTGATDPIPANNAASATVMVRPRPASRAIVYSGGSITGSSYTAHKSADVARAGRHRVRPMEIAAVLVRGKHCQWLKNHRGALNPSTKREPCGPPIWLTTATSKGGRWGYKLTQAPPRGRYLVLVRRRGDQVLEFGRILGNAFTLRLP